MKISIDETMFDIVSFYSVVEIIGSNNKSDQEKKNRTKTNSGN